MRNVLLRAALLLVAVFGLLVFGLRLRYGGGGEFTDRSGPPLFDSSALELVAALDLPPGNIAVSKSGRIFFSFHPEAWPPIQVAELIDGKPVAFPSRLPDGITLQAVLGIRIDRQERLWLLDQALHGMGQPRLLAFDLSTGEMVHRYDVPREIAGWGSHLNDFQVAPDGAMVYIADASILAKRPALIVYEVATGRARRLLEGHPSVTAETYVPTVQGRRMELLGVFAIRPGIDSIALDRRGEWLYYAPVTSNHLYRLRRTDLDNESLDSEILGERVEQYALKTMSDGIATDLDGSVYLTDPEHSAVVRLGTDRGLQTLVRDPRLRWPDGFSFGPDGWLYVTCSALHEVLLRSPGQIRSAGPFQIYRFRPGIDGVPGH